MSSSDASIPSFLRYSRENADSSAMAFLISGVSGVFHRWVVIVFVDLALLFRFSVSTSHLITYSSQGKPLMVFLAPVFFTEISDRTTLEVGLLFLASGRCPGMPFSLISEMDLSVYFLSLESRDQTTSLSSRVMVVDCWGPPASFPIMPPVNLKEESSLFIIPLTLEEDDISDAPIPANPPDFVSDSMRTSPYADQDIPRIRTTPYIHRIFFMEPSSISRLWNPPLPAPCLMFHIYRTYPTPP